MINSFHFLAPSLYPNTLVDIGIPEPGIDAPDPVVKHLAIKYGGHEAVGTVKALAERGDGNVSCFSDDHLPLEQANREFRLLRRMMRTDYQSYPCHKKSLQVSLQRSQINCR